MPRGKITIEVAEIDRLGLNANLTVLVLSDDQVDRLCAALKGSA